MATVVISDRLVNSVRWKVKQLYDKKLAEVSTQPDYWSSMFYEAAMPDEVVKKLAELPESYSRPFTGSFYLNIPGTNIAFNVRVDGRSDRIPYQFDWELNGCQGTTNLQLNGDDLRWDKLKGEFNDWRKTQREVELEINLAVENSSKILRTWRTLAPALKAWPPLWELLDQDIKDRHLLKTEKQSRKRVLPEMEGLDSLTGRVVAKRMTGE